MAHPWDEHARSVCVNHHLSSWISVPLILWRLHEFYSLKFFLVSGLLPDIAISGTGIAMHPLAKLHSDHAVLMQGFMPNAAASDWSIQRHPAHQAHKNSIDSCWLSIQHKHNICVQSPRHTTAISREDSSGPWQHRGKSFCQNKRSFDISFSCNSWENSLRSTCWHFFIFGAGRLIFLCANESQFSLHPCRKSDLSSWRKIDREKRHAGKSFHRGKFAAVTDLGTQCISRKFAALTDLGTQCIFKKFEEHGHGF